MRPISMAVHMFVTTVEIVGVAMIVFLMTQKKISNNLIQDIIK